jgi:hypothetical protein
LQRNALAHDVNIFEPREKKGKRTVHIKRIKKMGRDRGFDLYPPIDNESKEDVKKWNSFIEEVKTTFKEDKKVTLSETHILFDEGEGPKLPFDGSRFRRFNSKIDSFFSPIAQKINKVCGIASMYFDSEDANPDGINTKYSWSEVNEVQKE